MKAKLSDSDLVQESMIVAVRNYEGFRGKSPEALRNWLEGILRRKYLDAMKKYYRSGKSAINKEISIESIRTIAGDWDIPDRQGSPETERKGNEDLAERLFEEMSKLPEIDRILIERKATGKDSIAEIGRQLGMSPDSAHKRYQRALKKLYDRLSTRFEEFCWPSSAFDKWRSEYV
ncbi:sigma-70 family RNA polymerase sigma factor [bacterium]|nr:sigma-70 family RNA polymerase sigma factor [bacterium]